jgi:hypothetical protein
MQERPPPEPDLGYQKAKKTGRPLIFYDFRLFFLEISRRGLYVYGSEMFGGVAKRPKATVCKTVISWVRIPPPPVRFPPEKPTFSLKIPLLTAFIGSAFDMAGMPENDKE